MLAVTAGHRLSAGIARRCAAIVIDFDETLTANDTCGVLGTLGARADGELGAARWAGLVARFAEEYSATVPRLLPSPPLRHWDSSRFETFVAELAKFDSVCNARLEGGPLAGISESALSAAAAEEVVPRPGAAAVLQRLLRGDAGTGEVHVLSANWSEYFVRKALRHHFATAAALPTVTANRLVSTAGVTTGVIDWRVSTGGDKATWVRRWPSASPVGGEATTPASAAGLKVVIGDSPGDLAAMVEAGVGVIVKESSSLKATIEAFGLEVLQLDRLLTTVSEGSGELEALLAVREERATAGACPAPVLLMATGGWDEVGALLFGEGWDK